jgi:hypothetical protein
LCAGPRHFHTFSVLARTMRYQIICLEASVESKHGHVVYFLLSSTRCRGHGWDGGGITEGDNTTNISGNICMQCTTIGFFCSSLRCLEYGWHAYPGTFQLVRAVRNYLSTLVWRCVLSLGFEFGWSGSIIEHIIGSKSGNKTKYNKIILSVQ